jgi:hypothetical protein
LIQDSQDGQDPPIPESTPPQTIKTKKKKPIVDIGVSPSTPSNTSNFLSSGSQEASLQIDQSPQTTAIPSSPKDLHNDHLNDSKIEVSDVSSPSAIPDSQLTVLICETAEEQVDHSILPPQNIQIQENVEELQEAPIQTETTLPIQEDLTVSEPTTAIMQELKTNDIVQTNHMLSIEDNELKEASGSTAQNTIPPTIEQPHIDINPINPIETIITNISADKQADNMNEELPNSMDVPIIPTNSILFAVDTSLVQIQNDEMKQQNDEMKPREQHPIEEDEDEEEIRKLIEETKRMEEERMILAQKLKQQQQEPKPVVVETTPEANIYTDTLVTIESSGEPSFEPTVLELKVVNNAENQESNIEIGNQETAHVQESIQEIEKATETIVNTEEAHIVKEPISFIPEDSVSTASSVSVVDKDSHDHQDTAQSETALLSLSSTNKYYRKYFKEPSASSHEFPPPSLPSREREISKRNSLPIMSKRDDPPNVIEKFKQEVWLTAPLTYKL